MLRSPQAAALTGHTLDKHTRQASAAGPGIRRGVVERNEFAAPGRPAGDRFRRLGTVAGRPAAAAEALHRAAGALRREDPTNPLLWAPYLHIGI